MTRRTTIDDVARLAGVGKVTVSYVLNGRADQARISAETAERVFAAARELDYRPNGLARALSRQRTDTVAVVFQYADYFSASSSFINEVMRGVCEACVEEGLDVLLHTKPASDPTAEAGALTDGRVDGVLMLRDADDPTLNAVLGRRFPTVLFFTRTTQEGVPFVDCDNHSGGMLATEHLISLGHRRIGFLHGSVKSVDSVERGAGYRAALERHGIAYDPGLVRPFASADDDPRPFVELMRLPDRPTGLFVWSDDVAFECLRLLGGLGLDVPGDVSVVGFDSSAACDRVSPPLTSVNQPVAEMARAATKLLARILRGDAPAEGRQIVFPLELDVRASTQAVRPTPSHLTRP
ncbi:MAG: LacI family DNA-binding transcriptional regulator [Fimbriimonadaceae bacterium]|nr:LacI family DNA-binding transcriptional regulator [Fimbriimonadaceae bacterium]